MRIGLQPMEDVNYNIQFERLCNDLILGDMIDEPKEVSGGLLHRMYSVNL